MHTNKDWIMIVDGVDDLEAYDCKDYIPRCKHGTLIFTSTRSDSVVALKAHGMEVTGLDRKAAFTLLLLEIDTERLGSEDLIEAEKIVKVLDGIPLAIEQAGSLLRRNMPLQDFLKQYNSHYSKIMNMKPERSFWSYDKNRSICAVFSMLFDSLTRENADNAKLLTLCSIFASPGVLVEWLLQFRLFDEIPSKSQASGVEVPDRLRKAERDFGKAGWLADFAHDAIDFSSAVTRLKEFCMLKVRKDSGEGHPTLSLHNSVRRWRLETLESLEREEWILLSAYILAKKLAADNDVPDVNLQAVRLSRQVRHCWNLLGQYVSRHAIEVPHGRFCHQFGYVATQFATFALQLGLIAEVEEMFEEAVQYESIVQASAWPGDRRSLDLIKGLGLTLWKSGNLEKAGAMFNLLVTSSENLLGGEDEATLWAKNTLSEITDREALYARYQRRVLLATGGPERSKAPMVDEDNDDITPSPSEKDWGAEQPPHESMVKIMERELHLLGKVHESIRFLGDHHITTIEDTYSVAHFYLTHLRFNRAEPWIERLLIEASIESEAYLERLSLVFDVFHAQKDTLAINRFFHAIIENDFSQVFLMLRAKPGSVSARQDGKTGLHVAVGNNGWLGMVSLLIREGADVDAKDDAGRTPLHYAVICRNNSAIQPLLNAGASADATDYEGRTPLFFAVSCGNAFAVEWLLGSRTPLEALNGDESISLSCYGRVGLDCAWVNLDISRHQPGPDQPSHAESTPESGPWSLDVGIAGRLAVAKELSNSTSAALDGIEGYRNPLRQNILVRPGMRIADRFVFWCTLKSLAIISEKLNQLVETNFI
ncbi:MAG: hypothetical protein M1825_001007 [Sarcosagium campestre]|nr:MAG: hypothetical protein M1825_001007 [Sarcosagium campestre]